MQIIRKIFHRLSSVGPPVDWAAVALCVAILLGLVIIVCLIKLAFIDGI